MQAGTPFVYHGRLHSAATPGAEPETVRVELIPGSNAEIRFEVEDGRVVCLRFQSRAYERVPL